MLYHAAHVQLCPFKSVLLMGNPAQSLQVPARDEDRYQSTEFDAVHHDECAKLGQNGGGGCIFGTQL